MAHDRKGADPVRAAKNGSRLNFSSVSQSDVPHSRKGKHNQLVGSILGDVENVSSREAVRIPRGQLGSSVQKVRSALSRASKKRNVEVATAADDGYLYVWRKGVPET
jgi:hypothetical protein